MENKEVELTKDDLKAQNEYFFGHKEDENIFDSFLTNKMFAHRGLWDNESPENSLNAFKKAIEKDMELN